MSWAWMALTGQLMMLDNALIFACAAIVGIYLRGNSRLLMLSAWVLLIAQGPFALWLAPLSPDPLAISGGLLVRLPSIAAWAMILAGAALLPSHPARPSG